MAVKKTQGSRERDGSVLWSTSGRTAERQYYWCCAEEESRGKVVWRITERDPRRTRLISVVSSHGSLAVCSFLVFFGTEGAHGTQIVRIAHVKNRVQTETMRYHAKQRLL